MSDQTEIKKERRGGFRAGAGRPKGIPQTEGNKKASRIHLIKRRLLDHGIGKVEMSSSQVKALEVLLDRMEPKLSAIEYTDANPRDTADPAQLAGKLAALFADKPGLLEQVLSLRSKAEKSLENSGSTSPTLQ